MARTFPAAGQSPIDVYMTGLRPCAHLEAVPILVAGSEYIGLNIAVTPTGASGNWVTSIFAKVTYGATLLSQGYIDVAEFELVSTNTSPCYCFALGLNFNSAATDPHSAFIALRDYGAAPCKNVFYLGTEIEAAVGTKADVLFSTNVAGDATHHLRIMIGATKYYIMLSNAIA